MFPTLGLFQNYLCPDNNTRCCRPYCHFYHDPKKRERQKVSEVKIHENHESLAVGSSDQNCSLIHKVDVDSHDLAEPGKLVVNDAIVADSGSNSNISSLNLPSSNIDADILQKLISEAVKKVIVESSALNLANFDSNSVIKNLDTKSIVAKAIKEVTVVSKEWRIESTNSNEKKKPKLYLPPPNAPSYKPTPISELNRKKQPKSVALLQTGNEEYTPTSVVPCGYISCDDIPFNKASEESEITDFSSDTDEDARRSDFDLLEEVLAEHSSNPVRSREISKRKKALSKKIVKDLPPSIVLQQKNINSDEKIPTSLCKTNAPKEDKLINDNEENSIHPLSPLIPSTSDLTLEYNKPLLQNKECISAACDEINEDSLCKLTEEKSCVSHDSFIPAVKNIQKDSDPISVNSHRLVSQLAIPSRPNTKIWTPIAKPLTKETSCQSLESVETMLEKLDGVCNLSIANKDLPNHREITKSIEAKKECSQSDHDDEDKNPELLTDDSDISTPDTDLSSVNAKSHKRKRNLSISSNDSAKQDKRRKRKRKKFHKNDVKSKKRYRRDSSSDTEYYTSDLENPQKRHSKSKSKRSKHKLRHYHKKKSSRKHKRRKSEKKRSCKSSGQKRRHSYDNTNSGVESHSSDDVLIVDPSCIKKEKEDLDVYIVKIEKNDPMPPSKVDSVKKINNEGSNNPTDNISSDTNCPKITVTTGSSSVKDNTVNTVSSCNSENIILNDNCNGLEMTEIPVTNFGVDSVKMEDSIKNIITDNKCSIDVMEAQQNHPLIKHKRSLNDSLNIDIKPEIYNSNEKQQQNLHEELSCKIKKEPATSDKLPVNPPQLSMFDTVVAKMEQISKPRILKEISLFDSVSGKDSSKKSSKLAVSSKICKSDKTKHAIASTKSSNKSKKLKHNCNSSTQKLPSNSDGSKSRKHDLSSSKDKNTDLKKSTHISTKEESVYKTSKHADKDKARSHKTSLSSPKSSLKTDPVDESSKSKLETLKNFDSKKKSDHSSHRANSSDEKKKLTSATKDKHKSSPSATHIHNKKSESSKKSSHSDNKIGSKRRHSETIKKCNSKGRDNMEDGCDSPIPDLSALDELPEEDWDQLLSCNNPEARITEKQCASSDSDEGIDYEPAFSIEEDVVSESEDANNPKVMEECKKLFSEYDPDKNSQQMATMKSELVAPKEEPVREPVQKVRIARSGAAGNLISIPKPNSIPRKATPNQVMLDRFNKLREEKRQLEIQLEAQRKALEQHIKKPLNALSPSTLISNSSVTSTSDCIRTKISSQIPSVALGGCKKRIARVPSNVQAMLQPKAMIRKGQRENSSEVSTSILQKPTIAMSSAKGSKRVAHMPTVDVLVRPTVNIDGGTKVPQNIRQRYLNCFIDEASKFCDSTSQSYKVAITEEKICHQRAHTRMVYLNIAVNVIKKLRSFQISEAALELLQQDPEFDEVAESSHQVTSSSSTSNSCLSSHPINPNHRVISHFSVIAAGGNKGTWSIKKSKKPLDAEFKDILSESRFPKFLSKYLLKHDQLEENRYPRPDPSHKGKAVVTKLDTRKKISPNDTMRYCDRCAVLYEVDPWGLPLSSKPCAYHWGRPYKRRAFGGGLETKYSCCQGDNQADGCCLGTTHVSTNYTPDMLMGYVRTLPKDPQKDGYYGVYALDCEMCYTTAGNELTRLTVIDSNMKTVYETFVLPDNPIIDYNTRFSGITAEQMEGVKVTLRDVQATLLTIFSNKTILIGHSLESDFAALKLIHDTVIDTSIVFPHKLGAPYKRALRNLASEYLQKIIQNDVSGHDSAEDAVTCMELMRWKVKEDYKLLSLQGHSSSVK